MGLRGRAPKPTVLRILEGNQGKRPLPAKEPQPGPFDHRPPAHLDRIARREWRRLEEILTRMRVLTEADYIALGNLCVAYSTMVQAQEKLTESGLVMRTPSGYITQSPLLSIVNTAMDITMKHLREFGLTPAARSRVQAADERGQVDPLEAALCG